MPDNMNVKRTKIVATLGPATNSEEMIQALAERGVDVFRINFSHGTDEERLATIAAVKKVRSQLDLPLAILQDLQGPKIRLGVFSQGPCEIATGDAFRLTTRMADGNAEQASVDYPPLITEVRPGELVFIDDGLICLKVREIQGDTIVTDVLKGGVLSDHKGVNFPQSDLHVPSITEKDRHNLLTGLRAGVDYVALSFVQTSNDVRELRTLMETHGAHVPIIALMPDLVPPEERSPANGVINFMGGFGSLLLAFGIASTAELAGGTMLVMFPYAGIFFVLAAVCMLFMHPEDKPAVSSGQTLSANEPAV